MSLFELIDNTRTDKQSGHNYLETYQKLFENKKYSAKNVLELGIGSYHSNGGSIRLWYDFFTNATVHGIDILSMEQMWNNIVNISDETNENHKIILHTSCDGYNVDWFNKTFLEKNAKFDILIDDGPHSLESMVNFIKLYSQLLEEDGILIIEDVMDIQWTETLKETVPEHLKQYIEIYDFRYIKGWANDILFVINLSKK
jgi:hypothetical protein